MGAFILFDSPPRPWVFGPHYEYQIGGIPCRSIRRPTQGGQAHKIVEGFPIEIYSAWTF